jgi:hypothetical protein
MWQRGARIYAGAHLGGRLEQQQEALPSGRHELETFTADGKQKTFWIMRTKVDDFASELTCRGYTSDESRSRWNWLPVDLTDWSSGGIACSSIACGSSISSALDLKARLCHVCSKDHSIQI